ncbi:DUF4198 domain-containing protein [Phaeobacter sp. HF9A]|uniref:DUF4198 domain-containing protein n=1 Tax=Phaeobacter sp. HF9A TaxID=2721561 RepID=UPI0014309BB7|nr:DUF4198 domain-containing protein [Phaeobacter sp. HF9A]NIZ12219.1 DUF4198 domain-containing protein [Phaeobacter sp. HF9A]
MKPLRSGLGLLLITSASSALAHEFWLDAAPYSFAADSYVAADLRNGQQFSGITLPYLPKTTARFDYSLNGDVSSYEGRIGDFPAFHSEGFSPGLLVIVHETTPSTITYTDWEKFRHFAEDKGSPEVLDTHQGNSWPEQDFTESYSRHVKSLIAIGDGSGADHAFGLKTEFIAVTNPYAPEFTHDMQVELRLDNQPLPRATVTLFEKDAEAVVTTEKMQTDDLGQLTFQVHPGHSYLLDAVSFAPAPTGSDALWQTYWAALTFAVSE